MEQAARAFIQVQNALEIQHDMVRGIEALEDIANDRVGGRRDVTIRLLNEKHQPVAAWSATRCFPVKITAPDLKSDANEIAVESLEIAHEGLKLMKV